MRVDVVRPRDLGTTEVKRWREIQLADPLLQNPFLAPEFTQGVGTFRDNVRVAVVTEGPDVVAFLPYDQEILGVGHPVGFGLTDLQGIVADPGELTTLMGWKSDQYNRTGRTDRFARPWIVKLLEHFHSTGFGVLSVLYAGDRPVSAHFGLRNGHVM